LGRIHEDLGERQEALDYWNQALSSSRAVRERSIEAVVLNNIGRVYHISGERQKALEYHNQALLISREVSDHAGEARVLNNIGRVYHTSGERQKALDYYSQALLIARVAKDRSSEGTTLNNLGSVYRDLGERQKALDYYHQVLPIAREARDRSLEATTLNNLGQYYYSLGEPQKALDYSNKALPIYHVVGDRAGTAKVLNTIGVIYRALGDPKKALDCYNQAVSIYRDLGEHLKMAVNLSNIGLIYHELGELKRALDFYNQALPILRAENNQSIETATLLNNIGGIYKNLGDKQKALDFYNQALAISLIVKDSSTEGLILNNIARIYDDLGEMQKALKLYEKDLSITRSKGDKPGEVISLTNIGGIYSSLGDKQKALEFYNQALDLSRIIKDPVRESTALNNIAAVYSFLGDKQKALEFYERALAIKTGVSDQSGKAFTLNNLGKRHSDLGDQRKALEFYQQALTISHAIGDPTLKASILNNIGGAYMLLNDQRQALDYYNQALLISRGITDRVGEATTLNNIANIYIDLGENQKALEHYNQALPIMRAIGNRSGEALVLKNLASLNSVQSNLSGALANINDAIKIVELLRGELKNDDLKTSYFTSVQSYYQFKIDLLMRMHQQQPAKGYTAQAAETADQSRARVLRELLIQANANISKDISPTLLNEEQTLIQKLNAKEQQLAQRSSQPNTKPQTDKLEQEINNLYSQLEDLKTKIRQASPAYANLQYPKPITITQIQQQLDPDTLILQYSLGKDQSYLWVISNTDLKTYILPKQAELEKTVKILQKELTTTAPNSASTLSQQILAPAAADLSNKRLVIIPDGILHTVPFAALNRPNSKSYNPLITQHEITYLPSASTIAILRSTVAPKPRAPKQLAILADPIFSKTDDRLTNKSTQTIASIDIGEQQARNQTRNLNLQRLLFTKTEADGILKLIPKETDRTSAFGFDASYDWITDPKISQYRYLHLATHGFFDNDKPVLSSLILSSFDAQGRDRKAYLRFPDIFNLNLPTELVMLSACQTGLGNTVPGEGLIGMTHGFMYAGALRVGVSLWSVDDESTSELMQQFYQNLWQNKQSHAAALRQAQLSMHQKGQAPYYWAAFTLQGEWRN
jgi:tetratricopeptide (TPR) repeat protein